MTTTTTPEMPVTVVYCSSNKIIFKTTVPAAPLFLSLLTISLNTGVTDLVGNVNPGTPAHAVSRIIYASSVKFNEVSSLVLSGYSGLELNITYDSSYNVCDMICGGTIPPHLALDASLAIVSKRIGDGVVNDELRTLNQTAQGLLHALQHTAKLLSEGQGLEHRPSDVAPRQKTGS